MKKVTLRNNLGEVYGIVKMENPTQFIADETAAQLAEGMQITATVDDITYEEELKECHRLRMSEYPDLGDLVEALIENDTARKNELKALRNAVKAKYPKPVEPT